jgi:hypothetical protein
MGFSMSEGILGTGAEEDRESNGKEKVNAEAPRRPEEREQVGRGMPRA